MTGYMQILLLLVITALGFALSLAAEAWGARGGQPHDATRSGGGAWPVDLDPETGTNDFDDFGADSDRWITPDQGEIL